MVQRFKHRTTLKPSQRSGVVAAKLKKGLTFHQKGELSRARTKYQQVLKLEPNNHDGLHMLGVIACQTNQPQQAVDLIDRAIGINPENPACYNNRGIALQELKRYGEALECFDRALAYQPGNAELYINRGRALHDLRRLEEALESYGRALKLQPNHAKAYNNRGITLQGLKRFDDAIESYDHALALNPDYAECHWNLATCCFLMGDFVRAWEHHEWRPNLKNAKVAHARHLHRTPLPTDLAAQHVVVVREQGLGDELFFLRFAPMLRERGARVTYLADPRLVAMLNRAGIADRVLPTDANLGPCDLWLTVGDLPWLLGAGNLDTPAPFPIPPLAERLRVLSERLRAFGPPPYIGLTWRAGSGQAHTLSKEVPLDGFANAFCHLDATLVAVQRLPRAGDIAVVEKISGKPVLDLSALNDDLEDMLALMGLLDFYVCVSNTNLHLRAANGCASHVLVPYPVEFRWMADADESPWFQGSCVYREEATDEWSPAIDQLTHDLNRTGFP